MPSGLPAALHLLRRVGAASHLPSLLAPLGGLLICQIWPTHPLFGKPLTRPLHLASLATSQPAELPPQFGLWAHPLSVDWRVPKVRPCVVCMPLPALRNTTSSLGIAANLDNNSDSGHAALAGQHGWDFISLKPLAPIL